MKASSSPVLFSYIVASSCQLSATLYLALGCTWMAYLSQSALVIFDVAHGEFPPLWCDRRVRVKIGVQLQWFQCVLPHHYWPLRAPGSICMPPQTCIWRVGSSNSLRRMRLRLPFVQPLSTGQTSIISSTSKTETSTSKGHESAGQIVALGSNAQVANPGLSIGVAVALEVGVPYGSCEFCDTGRYNIFPLLRFRGAGSKFPHYRGMLQERVNHPTKWVYKLPSSLSYDVGSLIKPT